MNYLIKRNVMFIFFVIIVVSAYSQTEKSGLSDTNDYIIELTDNPLFKVAFKACAYSSDLVYLVSKPTPYFGRADRKKSIEMYKDTYNIFSYDGKYIYKGLLKKDRDELYTKYDPRVEKNTDTSYSVRLRGEKNLHYWMRQELKNGLMISIAFENGKYICRTFVIPTSVSGSKKFDDRKEAGKFAMEKAKDNHSVSIYRDTESGGWFVYYHDK